MLVARHVQLRNSSSIHTQFRRLGKFPAGRNAATVAIFGTVDGICYTARLCLRMDGHKYGKFFPMRLNS